MNRGRLEVADFFVSVGCFRIKWKDKVEEITFAKTVIGVNSAVCQFKCSHARYFAVNSDVRL